MTRIGVSVFLLAGSSVAAAQGHGDRAGAWELGVGMSSMSSEKFSGPNGSSATVDSGIGLGVSVGYNFTDRLALLVEANWVSPDYTARQPSADVSRSVTVDAELDGDTWHAKGVFYFSRSSFSPYIEVSGGWTRIVSNVADEPSTECWWDPWSGYVCGSFEAYDDIRASYATGFGVRWDPNRDTALKVKLGKFHIETKWETEDLSQETFRADFSWKF